MTTLRTFGVGEPYSRITRLPIGLARHGGDGAAILDRDRHGIFRLQHFGRMPRPVGVLQHGSRQANQIGGADADQFLRMPGIGDQADDTGRNADLLANGL
jgi:hypothetical protein